MAVLAAVEEPTTDSPPPPVNTICPVLGDRCPDDIPVVVVTVVDGQGRARLVSVAVCSRRCADLVKADPQRYGAAALSDRKAR